MDSSVLRLCRVTSGPRCTTEYLPSPAGQSESERDTLAQDRTGRQEGERTVESGSVACPVQLVDASHNTCGASVLSALVHWQQATLDGEYALRRRGAAMVSSMAKPFLRWLAGRPSASPSSRSAGPAGSAGACTARVVLRLHLSNVACQSVRDIRGSVSVSAITDSCIADAPDCSREKALGWAR
ncbi:hypothetical protein ColTof3_10444 [Colletotrichum tofieldiae]|nr:hypothetical protein ColTof3_10444 [Colletotrichum tofieldiae]